MSLFIQDRSEGNKLNGSLSESLIEALDSIKETKQDVSHLMQHHIPLSHIQDPDQLTDYPRSGSPDSAFSRSSLNGSRRSSLSAVSESSLNSENSFSHDANKRPTRNILKNPHRLKRRSKKNVRWNLPNGVSERIENDSDTTSLESFDSSSTSNSLYNRARNGIIETRRGWREFEKPPLPGSTGLTPSKPPFNRPSFHSRPHSAPHHPSWSPVKNISGKAFPYTKLPETVHEVPLASNSITSPNQARRRISLQPQFLRSPSSLIGPSASSISHSSGGFNRVSRTVYSTSTPIRRTLSESDTLRDSFQNLANGKSLPEENGNHSETVSLSYQIDNPLILKLSESKVADLEESTLEDRQRMHVFEFPQENRRDSQPSSSHSQLPSNVRTAFLEDDKNDYDHLSPLSLNTKERKGDKLKGSKFIQGMVASRNIGNGSKGGKLIEGMVASRNITNSSKGSKPIENTVVLRDKKINNRKSIISYTEDDLEEALREIENNSEGSSDEMSQEPVVDHEIPPPIPERKRSHQFHQEQDTHEQPSTQNKFKEMGKVQHFNPEPSQNPTKKVEQDSKKNVSVPASNMKPNPPPVPPKLNRIKLVDRDVTGNPKKDSQLDQKTFRYVTEYKHSNSTDPTQNLSYDELHDANESNILPPPPEFVSSYDNKLQSSGNSDKSPIGDDLVGGCSTSTLTEQDESLERAMKVVSKNSTQSINSDGNPEQMHAEFHSGPKKDHNWSNTHSMKITDRIVVGAEDTKLIREIPSSSQSSLSQELTQTNIPQMSRKLSQDSSTSRIPTQSHAHSEQPPYKQSYLQATINVTKMKSKPATSRRYKMSMETAFTEGNVMNNSTFVPPSRYTQQTHTSHTQSIPTSKQAYQMQKTQGVQRSTSAPTWPCPLPPHPKTGEQTVPTEDKMVMMSRFISSNQQHIRPTNNSADPEIKDLLVNLEINEEQSEKKQPMIGEFLHNLSLIFITCSYFTSYICLLYLAYINTNTSVQSP